MPVYENRQKGKKGSVSLHPIVQKRALYHSTLLYSTKKGSVSLHPIVQKRALYHSTLLYKKGSVSLHPVVQKGLCITPPYCTKRALYHSTLLFIQKGLCITPPYCRKVYTGDNKVLPHVSMFFTRCLVNSAPSSSRSACNFGVYKSLWSIILYHKYIIQIN